MELCHALFGGVHHLELREAHLEHHVRLRQHDFVADHNESACRGADVSQVELGSA